MATNCRPPLPNRNQGSFDDSNEEEEAEPAEE